MPEDRKGQGVVLDMPIYQNATMANSDLLTRFGFYQAGRERRIVDELIDKLRIKLASMNDPVSSLSGEAISRKSYWPNGFTRAATL